MAAVLLDINDLYCERDDRVLFEHLSFKLKQGQILQLVGKNGSGKTSLLRILCGLYSSYEGSVSFLGEEITASRDAYNSALLYIGHNVSVKNGLTARENLTWYAKIQPQLDEKLIDQALAKVGLKTYEEVICQNLSAGQKRRVNLARLFMLDETSFDKTLWILDEPFTAIDGEGVHNLEQQMSHYVANGGTVLITTHQELQMKENLQQLNLDEWGT
ncbi:MAG: cytochrome c biogenesis heme-transporting ATPase CcmA [Oceanospirillaceae bacterium]